MVLDPQWFQRLGPKLVWDLRWPCELAFRANRCPELTLSLAVEALPSQLERCSVSIQLGQLERRSVSVQLATVWLSLRAHRAEPFQLDLAARGLAVSAGSGGLVPD